MKCKTNVLDLFDQAKLNNTYLKVCAPMVRYSKVQFRTLVKNYGVDLCFTPMILADSFCQNAKARASEFSTTINDTPLIVQFAANNIDDFVDASALLYPYADGVDLNCGCPQRWAMKDGYGCALLSQPQTIYNLVKGVKNSLPNNFTVSVKIRILHELKKTIELCKQLENCGVSFLTVHGRTPAQKSSGEVNTDRLREVCELMKIPIIANGGVRTLADSDELHSYVKCSGVMAASGLLTNPALFSGSDRTPFTCIKQWMSMKDYDSDKLSFQCYHHHLVFMLDKILTKTQKTVFNNLSTFEAVDSYLNENILSSLVNDVPKEQLRSSIFNMDKFITCQYADEITIKHSKKCRGCGKSICYCVCSKYSSGDSNGIHFESFIKDNDEDSLDINIFDEVVY